MTPGTDVLRTDFYMFFIPYLLGIFFLNALLCILVAWSFAM